MKIGIIGHGFVGKALQNGIVNTDSLTIIDPKLGNKIKDLKIIEPDIIFICVPTPMHKDNSQNIDIVLDVISDIKKLSLKSVVVLKSTVLPNHIIEIENQIENFVYNPEFLREDFADEDFVNSNLILFGGSKKNCKFVSNFYINNTKCINTDHVFTDSISASLVKYSINSFLSTKVMFFNELYELFQKSGTDENWKNFIKALSKDERIGSSHMQVPGPDGRFGFGGACLPKDSSAFLGYSNEMQSQLEILSKVIELNNAIRSEYVNKTNREIEQNINFDKKK